MSKFPKTINVNGLTFTRKYNKGIDNRNMPVQSCGIILYQPPFFYMDEELKDGDLLTNSKRIRFYLEDWDWDDNDIGRWVIIPAGSILEYANGYLRFNDNYDEYNVSTLELMSGNFINIGEI